MSKRIRYVKTNKPNEIRSIRNYLGNQDALYQVKINTEDRTYRIVNVRQKSIIKSSEKDGVKPGKTLEITYRQAKRALKKLGVKFEHEFRNLEE